MAIVKKLRRWLKTSSPGEPFSNIYSVLSQYIRLPNRYWPSMLDGTKVVRTLDRCSSDNCKEFFSVNFCSRKKCLWEVAGVSETVREIGRERVFDFLNFFL